MRRAVAGWGLLVGYIVAYDCYLIRKQHPSLSESFRCAPRLLTGAVTGVVVAHLFGVLDPRVDPIQRLAAVISTNREAARGQAVR